MTAAPEEASWHREGPAPEESIQALNASAPVRLPHDYLQFLRESNGGEGDLGCQPGWFALWPAEKVLDRNSGYEVAANLPGHFGVGSSGGGELLAFDTRKGEPYPIVAVPFVPMEVAAAISVAGSFDEFRRLMGKPWRE